MLKKIVKEETLQTASEIILASRPEGSNGPVMTGTHYAFVEDGFLKGVIGLKRKSWYMTEVCHLAVKPEYQHTGIAEKMVAEVLTKVETPLAACTVPVGGSESYRLARKFGFNVCHAFNNSRGNQVYFMILNRDMVN